VVSRGDGGRPLFTPRDATIKPFYLHAGN
jgi:hypothetical protein